MAVRITGGELRGRLLATPKGRDVRPTPSRVRESVFSVLGQRVDGLAVLDVFAGVGTMGIEAGSRGAAHVTFIERQRAHAALISANAVMLDGLCPWDVLILDATRLDRITPPRRFDLVFLDPPYGSGLGVPTVQALLEQGWLAPGGQVLLEVEGKTALPDLVAGWPQHDRRRYGRTDVAFYRAGVSAGPPGSAVDDPGEPR
jgi:16S rRNA (guanine966-N2)-methyltransferase